MMVDVLAGCRELKLETEQIANGRRATGVRIVLTVWIEVSHLSLFIHVRRLDISLDITSSPSNDIGGFIMVNKRLQTQEVTQTLR